MVDKELKEMFLKQQYRFAGDHSAVKICEWTKKSLRNEGYCYKQKFYGIQSHRCLQMTPSVAWCPNRCVYCWRAIEKTEESPESGKGVDEPSEIIDRCIEAQRALLTGFKGLEKASRKKWEEAQEPNQAAISLSGEPTAYPKISELIEEFRRRGFTTFLVTNGQYPEKLEKLAEPTNLYISLDAPDKETYKRIDAPMLPDYWERLNRSLEIMSGFKCRKVVRLTLVKGWNDRNPEGYAELIRKSGADFIEVKSFMWVGYSRKRLKKENMLYHRDVKAFAEKLSKLTGYRYKDEDSRSRVVLLKR